MSTNKRDEPRAAAPRTNVIRWIIIVVLAVVVIVAVAIPRLTYWLGTRGKAVVILEPKTEDRVRTTTMATLERVLRERAEVLDLERPFVRSKRDTVTVAFKPGDDFQEVVTTLSTRGDMNFRPVPGDYGPDDRKITPTEIFLIGTDEKELLAQEVVKDVEPIVRRDDLRRKSSLDTDARTNQPLIRVYLEPTAEQALGIWYAGHENGLLAITFDDKIISVAPLPARVSDYMNISGIFDRKEAEKIVACLKTDPLPIDVAVRDKWLP